jgi:hypothetical protein
MGRSSQFCIGFKSCDLLSISLPFILWKSASPKASGAPKSKVEVNVLNFSDQSEDFRFVGRQPVFSRSWAVLRETWIKLLPFSRMLGVRSVRGVSSSVASWEPHAARYQVSTVAQTWYIYHEQKVISHSSRLRGWHLIRAFLLHHPTVEYGREQESKTEKARGRPNLSFYDELTPMITTFVACWRQCPMTQTSFARAHLPPLLLWESFQTGEFGGTHWSHSDTNTWNLARGKFRMLCYSPSQHFFLPLFIANFISISLVP